MQTRLPRRPRHLAVALGCALIAAGCGGGGDAAGPGPKGGKGVADRFAQIADSLREAGDEDGAVVVGGLADLARRVDRLQTVTVTVDGKAVEFTGMALEVTTSASACDADPDPGFCRDAYPPYALNFVAWRDQNLSEGFFGFADATGTSPVASEPLSFDEPAAGLLYFRRESGFAAGDLAPPFISDARLWIADEGSVTAARAVRSGACSGTASSGVLPGGTYTCYQAGADVAHDVHVSELRYDDVQPSTHALSMSSQRLPALAVDVTVAPRTSPALNASVVAALPGARAAATLRRALVQARR